MTRSVFVLALGLALSAAACSNPADGKPQAKVEEAAPAEAPAAAKAGDATYAANVESSKLGFVGSKVTGSHEGGFKAFTATVVPADGKVEGGSVAVEIDVGSMFTDDEKLTGHLKSPDFFDAEGHPKAKFQSTAIKAGGEGRSHTVEGNLELHGVTKKITFPADIVMKDGKVDVDTEFSINRKDFEMVYDGMPDDLIRDEVVIKLDITFDQKS